MGYSVPAALGAKLAAPEKPVIALAGDGAFLMTGMELITAASEGIAAIVCVLRDGELAQIAQFQTGRDEPEDEERARGVRIGVALRGDGSGVSRAPARRGHRGGAVARGGDRRGTGAPVVIDVAIDYSEKTFFTRGRGEDDPRAAAAARIACGSSGGRWGGRSRAAGIAAFPDAGGPARGRRPTIEHN